MLDRPFPASWTVRRARDAYLAENGFTVEAYDDAFTEGAILGLAVMIPNTTKHRWAIMLHDLHHVATGFGTDLAGEGEISAWEGRRGLTNLGLYVSTIVAFAALLGVSIAPRRTLAAFRGSGKGRASLFAIDPEYSAMLDLTVGELRAQLGVPREGLAMRRAVHSRAPKLATP